jgi:hypothetical protein
MDAQQNRAVPPNAADAQQPAAPAQPVVAPRAQAAAVRAQPAGPGAQPVAPRAQPVAHVVALPAGPILANLAVPMMVPRAGPVVAKMVVPPGPANVAGGIVPVGDQFDVSSALVGPAPKRSNMSFKIWP